MMSPKERELMRGFVHEPVQAGEVPPVGVIVSGLFVFVSNDFSLADAKNTVFIRAPTAFRSSGDPHSWMAVLLDHAFC
jgi:hypothetical protein